MATPSCLWTLFRIQYFISLSCFALSCNISWFEQKTDGLIPYTGEETKAKARSGFECLAKCGRSDSCLGVALMASAPDCRMFLHDGGAVDQTRVKYFHVSTDSSHVTWVTSEFEDLNVTVWTETVVTTTDENKAPSEAPTTTTEAQTTTTEAQTTTTEASTTTTEASTTTTEAPTTTGSACPLMFTETSSGCFYVEIQSVNRRSWEEAEEFCRSLGDNVHLAVTNTSEVRGTTAVAKATS